MPHLKALYFVRPTK
jgi:vacuolar protein sorting-associated protein 45